MKQIYYINRCGTKGRSVMTSTPPCIPDFFSIHFTNAAGYIRYALIVVYYSHFSFSFFQKWKYHFTREETY